MSFVSLRKTLLMFSVCFCLRTWAQERTVVLDPRPNSLAGIGGSRVPLASAMSTSAR